ncbi:MAG: hypothetical protein EP324_06985 [Gammaproteobacteria bacterium]|nr:MAG: hypothetical protein EP324_06985 [Gammaproteobacteria bacterium]
MPAADDGFVNNEEESAGVLATITLDPTVVLVPGDTVRLNVIGTGGSESVTTYTLTQEDIDNGFVTLPLDLEGVAEGDVDVTATVVTDTGESTSNTVEFVYDATAPDAPIIDETAGAIVSGEAEANSTVFIDTNSDGTYDIETTADENGDWSVLLDEPLSDGTLVTAVAEDEAGNVSSPGSAEVTGEVAAPINLKVVTPLLGLLLGSDIQGTAVGATQVQITVFQDDLFASLAGGTITVDVDDEGNFSVPLTVLGELLDSVLALLVGDEGVLLGFAAVYEDGSVSSTELVYVGEGTSVIDDPTAALVDLIDALVAGLLGASEDLLVEGSVYLGNEQGNYFTGTAEAELMAGDDGNDVLIGGGGADIISGGTGNDFIAVADDTFTAVDGGQGFDVFSWSGGDITLDLENLSERLSNIELIDLNSSSAVTLQVTLDSLVNVTDAETGRLYINGDSNDTVDLIGSWESSGTGVSDGVEYTIYTQSGDSNELWVQSGISVI